MLAFPDLIKAQNTISKEEEELRVKGNFSEFFGSVKSNKDLNCLCKQNEYLIFNFTTSTNKIASLCSSKIVTMSSGYLVYRYGARNKTELEYPADTLNSFSKFEFSAYSRGGGKQNAAMELNSLSFTNNNFTYTLFDEYYSEDKSHPKGIRITNNTTKKEVTINVKGKATGHLSVFRGKQIVKAAPDDGN
jgi:hypothetical protein